ncbi:C-terminal processing protease CtpA/Prc [Flavobacterium sp. 90]|uniref:S41 family peptidase n=1 Tax=unclassified Flavobacterium TaxID=196869 RepID=UPI000EAF3B9C|nr:MULTISPECIES: S41 family peptidase [unclassified Flavobacterium]RKR09914.1 C-terminal processing protease CtpA/Prc [Flavobacterium sp. 81]TCK53699.1 C-terminal processing protease CtpA/Prc [Flavobacterium sp. 90]
MKKALLIVLVLLFQYSFSKPITETQKLAATCKVWGFLKFYHPNVTDGSKNWDEQLFQILPKVEEAQTAEAFSLVIENWIVSLGEVKKYEAARSTVKKESFDKNFDLSWISKNDLFSKSLSKKLKFIEENRIQGKQFYYISDPYIKVQNEVKYPDFKWSDKNLRLLALFRYWNQMEYFFPYKYKMDENWDTVLIEMLPRFIAPESEKDFVLAMREISIKLDDTHASTQTNKMFDYFGDKFTPFDVVFIDNKAVVVNLKNDSLAKVDDIRIGDVITKVEGKTVENLINENLKYAEGSNRPAILKNIYWAVFNGKTETFEIEFNRNNNTLVKTIKRYKYQNLKIQYKDEEKWKLLEGNIGYIDVESINKDELPAVMEQFKNTKAIVFDARKYPQEPNIEEDIAQYLYPEEKAYAKFIDVDLTYPGKFTWREDQKTGKTNPDYYKGKVIILENEKTQSHGEHLVMCLQAAPNATIIGSQTAGADGGVCKYEIIKGYPTIFTGFGIFYPNRKETQRVGIIPDIEVKPTILGVQQGKDEVLDRAILFAKNGK